MISTVTFCASLSAAQTRLLVSAVCDCILTHPVKGLGSHHVSGLLCYILRTLPVARRIRRTADAIKLHNPC